MKPERIYFIGYRGSGKTTVGRLLAERLDWRFVDADEELKRRSGETLVNLFSAEGEAGFRKRESALLTELAQLDQHVVACGGGAILSADNRRLLESSGFCVWLTADCKTLIERIAGDSRSHEFRPALTKLPPAQEVAQKLQEREPLYRETAHLIVNTARQSPDAVVSAILSAWTN